MSDERLPRGQQWIDHVIEYAKLGIPKIDMKRWRLRVRGEIGNTLNLRLDELKSLASVEIVDDLHCVEGWSVKGIRWSGVPVIKIIDLARPKPSATYAMFRCADGYSTVAPLEDLTSRQALLATRMNGETLTVEAGRPVRLIITGLYAWKYAKWVSEMEFLDHYEPGYWESRGYHPRGDVWKEERRG